MGRGYGYLRADKPTNAIGVAYTPDHSYQYNTSGAPNRVTRTGIGSYTVRFPNLAAYGTALVTAYGQSSGRPDDRCKISDWGAEPGATGGSDTIVHVRCFTRAGTAADSQFTASYTYPEQGAAARAAYLRFDQLSSPLGATGHAG